MREIEAAKRCLLGGCGGCPFNNISEPCAEAFARYIVNCVEGIPDLKTYKEVATHDALIITADGVNGFAWYDGELHMEDGFVYPTLRFANGKVQELVADDGERSVAWSS